MRRSSVADVDWDTQRGSTGEMHYPVYLLGAWREVPDAAVITEPNRYGMAVVWPVVHSRRFCARSGYSPMVRMTLLSGRVLLEDSLSSCASISSYFGTVVTSPFGTMCTTL
jgi:hypothetical protein